MTFCRHSSSLVSINGWFTCQKCFRLVRHPWVNPTIRESRKVQPQSGIERMEKELETADKKLMKSMGIR